MEKDRESTTVISRFASRRARRALSSGGLLLTISTRGAGTLEVKKTWASLHRRGGGMGGREWRGALSVEV